TRCRRGSRSRRRVSSRGTSRSSSGPGGTWCTGWSTRSAWWTSRRGRSWTNSGRGGTDRMAAPPGSPNWPPWRSVWLARAVLAAALVAGVPPFLRMPPWCDATLYDVAARNLLRGGVHYRDVFDTNTPGFVWAVAAVRAALGWSTEALRAVDLAI